MAIGPKSSVQFIPDLFPAHYMYIVFLQQLPHSGLAKKSNSVCRHAEAQSYCLRLIKNKRRNRTIYFALLMPVLYLTIYHLNLLYVRNKCTAWAL
jgi:hypothetical protein